MHDRLDDTWLDALGGRADPDAAAALAARLAADPAAARAFDGWRRLAAAVDQAAAARGAAPPPLDAVLAAIRAPAASTLSATPHDALGRATLRRLATQPAPTVDVAQPVAGWIVAAAAVAAAIVVALWPTPAGPLGGALIAALRSPSAEMHTAAPTSPTAVARRGDVAARLFVGPAAAGTSASATSAARAHGAGPIAGDADAAGADGRPPAAGVTGVAAAQSAARRASAGRGALGAAVPAARSGPPGAAPGGGYPAPVDRAAAYPAPLAPVAAGRSPGRRSPSKPAPRPSDTPPPSPTAVPTEPLPTATAAPTAPPTATAAPAVIGVVSGADGGGRAQVRLAAYRDDDQPIARAWVETFTADATGHYTLTVPPGSWRLYADAPGHRPQWWPGADHPSGGAVVTVADAPVVVDWRLSAVAETDGLLVGRAGPRALVRAVPAGADPAAAVGPSALADAGGHFALPLAAGDWTVARSADGREHGWERLPDAVTIAPGATTAVDWP